MSDNPNYYVQEGQPLQRPVKKRKHRFIKVISILLVIAILSMTAVNYFVEPVLISRLTKGTFFGFHTTRVTADELENTQSITKPADKEIRDFGKFAKKLSNRFYLSLTGEEKEDFKEIKDGAKQITAFLRSPETAQKPTEGNITALGMEKVGESLKKDSESFLYFIPATASLGRSASLTVKAKNSDEKDEKELYDPEVLNDISVVLYTSGYPELAAAVTSMVAADYPENSMSALNFGTILREVNADEDAFNVLQYALRMNPSSEPILYSLGMCALDLRNTSYAQSCFSKILSLNGSSGPGHQGMMLCYMDTGNYSSAFQHMLDGAREGYTTMVIETYKALRQKPNEYMGIAKSILEQYSFEQLLDFSKSRTPFDNTLDTPEGQLEISRDINLGTDSASVYSSSDAMQKGMQFAMSAYSHGKATIEDALGMVPDDEMSDLLGGLVGLIQQDAEEAPDEMLKPVSKSILEKIFGSAADGATVSSDGWLGISYEAEVFWLNIMDDYVHIKMDDYIEEYFEKPYDDAFNSSNSVTPSLDKYHETLEQLAASNPLQAGAMTLNNMINNDSAYDTGVQKADKKDMDKFLQNINPKLEEGYKKTADLMELYWLHSGSILGQIGNDETYNRFQQLRKTTVASALTPYVVGGTINCMMVTMNLSMVNPNQSGGGNITYPDFPEFPDSQMGEAYDPPTPQKPNQGENPEHQGEEPSADENHEQAEDPSADENTPEQQEEPTGSDGKLTDEENTPAPGPGNPGTSDITTEDSISIFIGPLSVTLNRKTGWEVDLTAVGSVNVRYDKRTGDLSLFGGAGLSAGAATTGVSARVGVYATLNSSTMDITSGSRATVEGQLAGNGIGVEKQSCVTTGADTTAVSAILLHKKSSQTIYENQSMQ